MPVAPKLAFPIMVALLAATASPVRAEGRAEFVSCQAMVERTKQAVEANTGTAGARQDEAALRRCRQIVIDWTLRESRMSVDENGRPLR
ncbi:hypothetical protein [Bradyrhizobium erythrophlei]|jgi:hypothetical protein|uniref:UrcA family protein n=1 Tax=Bradyrhizobium erythrophlei TaxID=1437360 RepID=A0A1M5U0X6_9BRAD|nr:hypothetical protein [Bradyrhizobium erythrophlei]SHH56677.1 hypothetical protein SAMN05444169_8111 [Bradyrhizobium erythrophlei]